MTTVIPQSELTRRAIDWMSEQGAAGADRASLHQLMEAAAVRFNLGPLDVEFLERFYAQCGAGESKP